MKTPMATEARHRLLEICIRKRVVLDLNEENEPNLAVFRALSLKRSSSKIPTLEYSEEYNWLANWSLTNLESRYSSNFNYIVTSQIPFVFRVK